MTTTQSPSTKIVLYGHQACPGVPPVRGMLKYSQVAYEYVNILQDQEAAAQVRAINNGNESVPTLLFPDGSTLTEPSAGQLKAKLESLGYKVSIFAWLTGNMWRIAFLGIVIYAGLRFFEII